MGDKWNSDRDEQMAGMPGEDRVRGLADDEDFDDAEELDEEDAEDAEESTTF